MKDKNFGITHEEFMKMTQNLKNGNEEIFEHIFLGHFEKSLMFLKQNYTMSQEQAYDACMDALIDFRKGLLNDKYSYGNLNFLFTKMASQRFFKSTRKIVHFLPIDNQLELADETINLDAEELKILDKAWDKLGENCKALLKMFYYENRKLKTIAESELKTPASLRKQKERCMNALRMNFQRSVNI